QNTRPSQPARQPEEAQQTEARAGESAKEKSGNEATEGGDEDSAKSESSESEIEFKLPPLGEGVNTADIAEILVSEGDVIEAEDVVMELETEKAVVELPCPHAGKIKKIHVSPGDSIEVGST